MGGTTAHVSGTPEDDQATGWTGTLVPGFGLFQFSHDRTGAEDAGSSEAETGDDYLAIYDDNDQQVWIYSKKADTWDDDAASANNAVIDIGSTGGAEVNFYFADGALRVSDGNFNNTNQWYGYIYSKLFQTTGGTAELTLDTWKSTDQELKSFDNLSVNLVLDDCSDANPAAAEIAVDQITLGWWTGEDGEWNGQYYLGVSPVYIGNQEGPITESDDTITLVNQILYVQVFIGHTDTITSGTISTHPLNDDRIIGIRLYIRAYPSEEWYLLKDIDLIAGGEFAWKEYNSGETATGFWVGGTGVTGDSQTEDDGGNKLTGAAIGIYTIADTAEYADTTMEVRVSVGGSGMGTGRKGILRISGFGSTVYREVDVSSAGLQSGGDLSSIPVVNPSNGNKKKFTIELLDESYGILEKQIQEIQIDVDADAEPPPDPPGGGGFGGGS
tara:strand:+ start:7 stop:1332 length:1326 start_codon:yes stop_codon:yes gene_type:complete